VEEENQCLAGGSLGSQVVDVGKDIEKWIKSLGKTHKSSGQKICPYAEKALQDKTIQISKAKVDLLEHIVHCSHLVPCFHLDAVVLYIEYKITEKRLAKICRDANRNRPHMAILYDHPNNQGLHKGVSFSYGKLPLVIIQPLDKLQSAQSKLRRTRYYKDWGLDPQDDMFY
jgi:hypothetical protein